MIGRVMNWLLHQTAPSKTREAAEHFTESQLVREEKRNAASRLMAALEGVDEPYYVSESLTRRAPRRNGHGD